MRRTLDRYAARIARGEVSPAAACAARTGWVFDSAREEVPLSLLDFGRFVLGTTPWELATGPRECVLVPIQGRWECAVGGRRFRGGRPGGPFAAPAGASNAEALYLPRGATAIFTGDAELIAYRAPALADAAPAHVGPGARPCVVRGVGPWRRRVVTLVEPGAVSTALVVGETWSPPGGWSGTPLHTHDADRPDQGESDHEEVYFHLSPLAGQGQGGCHTVQLLLIGETLAESYVMRDRTAFAIPGGAHPVAASPVAPALYGWGLAGAGAALGMADVPAFAYLREVEAELAALEGGAGPALSPARWRELRARLGAPARLVLEALLAERGFQPPPDSEAR